MENFFEELKKYFKEIPREKVLEDWEKSKECDDIGITVEEFLMSNTVYFQPKGIRPQYCEAGMIHESDPEYILYLDEPCKILISEVKVIPKEEVIYDKKNRQYLVKRDASLNGG